MNQIMISKTDLLQKSKLYNYKPEILEKVYRLLKALEQFVSIPYLRDRLVLKGGTALNLFHFENIPRLSVDIDLNYIGQLDRSKMLEERAVINEAIRQIFRQNQFILDRNPNRHAGGKMVWRYQSALGQMGNLEIDLNYMYRRPLWPVIWMEPTIYLEKLTKIPTLDLHELVAGKLAALFERRASRDLFDAHYLLTKSNLSINKLRVAFVIYLAMTKIELKNLNEFHIDYDITEMRNQLFPLLRQHNLERSRPKIKIWADKLLNELREALSKIIPLKNNEINFITQIRESGIIRPELITDDETLTKTISIHPAIQWVVLKK